MMPAVSPFTLDQAILLMRFLSSPQRPKTRSIKIVSGMTIDLFVRSSRKGMDRRTVEHGLSTNLNYEPE